MPAWLPLLRATLPHLSNLVSVAVPLFTKSNEKSAAVMAQQITELQEAVQKNATSVKVLAEELRRTVEAIQLAAIANEKTMKQLRGVTIASLALAAAAIVVGIIALTR